METGKHLTPAREAFDAWWFAMEGFGMRCERPQTHTEAAWMAWQVREEEVRMLKSRVKVLEAECQWLNSVGPDKK